MKDVVKLIIVVAVVSVIAFPILAYMGVNSPLPLADWGNSIYTTLSSKVATTMGTVTGLTVGTGVSTAAAAALAFAYSQKSKVANWLNKQVASKEADLKAQSTVIEEQTTALGSVTKLKDDALATITQKEQAFTTELSGYKSQLASMEGQLKTQADQAQALVTKNSALINDAVANKLPANQIFTSATDPNKKVLIVPEKYVT